MIRTATGIEQTNAPVKPLRQNFDASVLVDKYGDFLYRFALTRVRDSFVAEDLVQETLLAALKNMKNFSGKSSERTWLTGILKNKIVDFFRRACREQLFDETEDEDFFQTDGSWKPEFAPKSWNASPEQMVENQEFWQVFNRCLSTLPGKTAAAFVLREIEGMETEEICQTLEISSNNLWVLLHRARMQLRRQIEINFFAAKNVL